MSRSISSQRETYKIACDEYLDKNLENLLVESLMSDFYLFEYCDTKKIEIFLNLEENGIKSNEDNKLINLFIEIDGDKDGLISCEDLYEFACKRKIKICNKELQNFIGLFDEDLDGFLDWNEFLFMILPSSLSFEYNLDSLKKQEEMYNQFYYQQKKCYSCCYNNNINDCNYNLMKNENTNLNYNMNCYCKNEKYENNNYIDNNNYESKNYTELHTNFDYSI